MGQPFSRRIKLFKARLKELSLSDETKADYKDVLSRLKAFRSERDRIAHAVFNAHIGEFGNEAKKASSMSQQWKGKFKDADFTTITQDELRGLFLKMHQLFWDLHDLKLHQRLYVEHRPPAGRSLRREAT